jgi:hypothetical protein
LHLGYPRNLSRQILSTVLGCDLNVANPGPSQCFFLHCISGWSGSLIVAAPLVLDGCNGITSAGDDEKVNALAVIAL